MLICLIISFGFEVDAYQGSLLDMGSFASSMINSLESTD